MKHLLLSLALIASANTWAEDEFPIELTCEVGANIIYLHFDEDEDKSWWTPHSSTESGGRWGAMFANDNFKNKKNKLNRYAITDSAITFRIRSANEKSEFILNRYSLKVNSPTYHGQCYKGFKEYEKQI